MTAWPTAPLGNVARLERDMVLPDAIRPGTKYLGLEHIESGGRILAVTPVANGELKSTKFAFTPEHILYGKLRPYLAKITLPDFTGVCTTEIVPIAPGPRMDRHFLAHFLRQPDQIALATARSTGANLPRLSPGELAKFDVPVPPLVDQRRIAAILDEADALREKRRAALAKLDEMARAVFVEMFGDPTTNLKKWPTLPLASLCTIAGEYGSSVPSVDADPSLPRYVRITDISSTGTLNLECVSPGGSSADWENLFLNEGDVLFARSGATVGKTFLYSKRYGLCVFAGYLIRFRPDTTRLRPGFLFSFTKTKAYADWVAVRQRVVAQPNINAKQYGQDLFVPVPPVGLQSEFERRLTELDQMRGQHEGALEALDSLFASLQHRAFRGEL